MKPILFRSLFMPFKLSLVCLYFVFYMMQSYIALVYRVFQKFVDTFLYK